MTRDGIKGDVVRRLTRELPWMSPEGASDAIDIVLNAITELTVERGTVRIGDFGCWQVTYSAGKPIGVSFLATGRFNQRARDSWKPTNGEPT